MGPRPEEHAHPYQHEHEHAPYCCARSSTSSRTRAASAVPFIALIAAIDEALAAQPDLLQKIREGKVQAAGAVIGAVMKAMKGTADAARVRELVLERAQQ